MASKSVGRLWAWRHHRSRLSLTALFYPLAIQKSQFRLENLHSQLGNFGTCAHSLPLPPSILSSIFPIRASSLLHLSSYTKSLFLPCLILMSAPHCIDSSVLAFIAFVIPHRPTTIYNAGLSSLLTRLRNLLFSEYIISSFLRIF